MTDGNKQKRQSLVDGDLLSEELVGRQFGPLTIATRMIRGKADKLEVQVDCSLCGERGWRFYHKMSRRVPRGCEHCMNKFGDHCPEWVWRRVQHQRQRCQCPQNNMYHRYGGRGIEFRFTTTYEAACWIVKHLGAPESKAMTLDRIDSEGHYEPGNLRWASAETQSRNRDCAWRWKLRQDFPFVQYSDGNLSRLRKKGLNPQQIADHWLSKYGTS